MSWYHYYYLKILYNVFGLGGAILMVSSAFGIVFISYDIFKHLDKYKRKGQDKFIKRIYLEAVCVIVLLIMFYIGMGLAPYQFVADHIIK